MAPNLYRFSRRLNVGRAVCSHLLGKEHSTAHHMLVGVAVMALGVFIAKTTGHHPVEIVAYIGDTVGYAVHGLGLTPFVESLIASFGEAIVEAEEI